MVYWLVQRCHDGARRRAAALGPRPMRPPSLLALLLAGAASPGTSGTATAADRRRDRRARRPTARPPQQLGFPTIATRNTTRVGGADAVADAAAVAQAVFPAQPRDPARRGRRWSTRTTGRAASRPACSSRRRCARRSCSPTAATLPGRDLDGARRRSAPRRPEAAGDAQVDPRSATAAAPGGAEGAPAIKGNDVFAIAARDRHARERRRRASRRPSHDRRSAERPELRDAGRGLGSQVRRRRCCSPAATRSRRRPRRAIAATSSRNIYMLGPEHGDLRARSSTSCASSAQVDAHRRRTTGRQRDRVRPLRRRRRSAGASSTPATAWCSPTRAARSTPRPPRPLSATASRPAAAGRPTPTRCPRPLERYLLDIQPGYEERPGARRLQSRLDHRRRGRDLASPSQARIDALLEIVPVGQTASSLPADERGRATRAPRPGHESTVEDVRQLMGASTPHFALQIRNRIRRLIAACPPTTRRASRASARSRASSALGLRARSAATRARRAAAAAAA